MLTEQYGVDVSATTYPRYLSMQALTDSQSKISFYVVPVDGGIPVLITPPKG
jgi:hypothetical protein